MHKVVSKLFEWNHGNLFETIEDDRGGKTIKVRLTNEIRRHKLTSDFLMLKSRFEKETFKPLLINYSVTVGGVLTKDDPEDFDYIFIGTLTIY